MKLLNRGSLCLLLATLLSACGQQLVEFSRADGAIRDATSIEAGQLETSVGDTAGDLQDQEAAGMAGAWAGGAGAFILDTSVWSVAGNGCPL